MATLPWNLTSSALLPRLDRLIPRNPFSIAATAVRA
jgi:hypothetical protein